MTIGNEAEYYARRAWVTFKRSLGFPIKSDKKFLCEEIVRGMISGAINKETIFTNDRMPGEGIGSQILSRLSVASTVRELGYGFTYTPLHKLGHPEGDPASWTRRIDDAFGLERGEVDAADCDLRRVNIFEYCGNKDLWRQKMLVCVRDFYAYTDCNPTALATYARGRIRFDSPGDDEYYNIAMHVRRGDVSRQKNSNRFIPNSHVKPTLEAICSLMDEAGIPYRVSVYTNGSNDEMADLASGIVRIVNTLGAVETLNRLSTADLLVATNSTFSYLASILNEGIVLCGKSTHTHLPDWLRINKDGSFDAERVKDLVGKRTSAWRKQEIE